MADWPWYQFALVFGASLAVFVVGARQKRLALNGRTWLEMTQAALIVVFLFAWLSDGRGCAAAPPADDVLCAPDPRC